jgi:hypothetical protein
MAPRSSLKVLGGPLDGRELALPDDAGEVLIGEDPSCQLRLELPGLSPIHARLRREAAGTTVYEAGSPGPIYVNDDRVRGRAPLRNGDILWLGPPGDAQSVMIRCRLAPVSAISAADPTVPATPAPSVSAPPPAAGPLDAGDEPFFIADAPEIAAAASDDVEFIAELPETPATAAPAGDDAFFIEEPAGAPAVALGSDEFFIADPEPTETASPADAPAVAAPPPSQPAPRAPVLPAPAGAPNPAPPAADALAAKSPRPVAKAAAPPAVKPAPASAAARPAAPGAVSKPRAGPAARRPAPVAAARRAPASSRAGLIAAAAAGLAVLAGGGWLALQATGAPRLETMSPQRVKVGQVVTLVGRRFSASREGNRVLFGDRAGSLVAASATEIQVEVPDLPTTAGRDLKVQVAVEAGGRRTGALELAVYQSPRIHGLSPDVGMPGDELTLAGSGWGPGAAVHFGSRPAELLMTSPTALRARVPALDGAPGTVVPVSVAIGGERSNEASFVIGRLPLLLGVEPAQAAPGDLVRLRGRGFHVDAQRNTVSIAGLRALIVESNAGELQVMVPFASGEAALEVKVPGSSEAARALVSVAAGDPVEWRFAAEPFEDAAGHHHVFLTTALGPAFVLSPAGGRTAAERAVEATRRLNESAAVLRSSLDADFRARGHAVELVPKETPVLEVSPEDAAAYAENWTGGRGGAATPERLAQWWAAIARDLVLMLVRNEKPAHAAGLGPEGRVLGEVFQAARRGGQYGVARRVVADLKPAQRQALRVLAQRVPAALAGPGPALPGQPAAAGAPGAATPLRLQGKWTGFEDEQSSRKLISVSFGRSGGTLTFTEGVSIGVPLLSAETPQRNTVRFSAQVRGGVRYYFGSWNGETLSGRITTDPAGRNAVGSFELTPGL